MTASEKQFLKNLGFSYHKDPDGESFSKLYSGLGTFWINESTRMGQIDFPLVSLDIRGDMLRKQELDLKKFLKEYSIDLKLIRKKGILMERD